MAVVPYSLVGMLTSTSGTGTMTLTSAIPSYSSLADAGVSDAEQVPYLIKQGDNRELGVGTVGGTGTTLTRDTVNRSIIAGVVGTTKLTLTGTEEVYLTIRDVDLSELMSFAQTFTLPTADGTADQVLKTDGSGVLSFADAGGGLVPISKVTASASAAVDIALTGGYSAYLIRLEEVTAASDGVTFRLYTSSDGGSTFDSGASDYSYSFAVMGTSLLGSDVQNSNFVILASSIGNAAAEGINGTLKVYPSQGSVYNTISADLALIADGPLQNSIVGACSRNSTTPINAIRLFMSSGNIASGDFHLYGIADGA